MKWSVGSTSSPRRGARGPGKFRARIESLEERRLLTVIPVNTFADETTPNDGQISLREAIAVAARLPGDDVITLPHKIGGIEGAYALGGSPLFIDDPSGKLTIETSGGTATIDAQQHSRVFLVSQRSQVALIGLTITRGNGVDIFGLSCGGGIYNAGTLEINDCTLSDNSTGYLGIDRSYGGGVFNRGTLHIIGSTLSGNISDVGGGIYNGYGGTLEITDSTVSGNFGYFYGGGVADGDGSGSTFFPSPGGTVTITRSTISDNSAKRGGILGGGVFNSFDSTLSIVDSTLSGNIANQGGGVFNQSKRVGSQWKDGTVTITGSTLSGNFARSFTGGGGGGVKNDGVMTITDSTLSGNSGGIGGGVANGDPGYDGFISDPSATLTIANSTLSDNSADKAAGGGVFNWGDMTITGSTFRGNSSGGSNDRIYYRQNDGGGVFNNHAAVITDCVFIGNSARAGSGGGIANGTYLPAPGPNLPTTLTIARCTFSGNSVGNEAGSNYYGEFDGGGVINYANNGDLTITDSTFTANSAEFGHGGGIFIDSSGNGMSLISHNVIQGNLGEGLAVGIQSYFYYFYYYTHPIPLVTVTDNTITSNSKAGVLLETPFTPYDGVTPTGTLAVGNTIAFNGAAGVAVIGYDPSNSIRGNSIYGNAGLPIDLGDDGPTANDELDSDDGPNNLQNAPLLALAISNGTSARVSGVLHSTPNTSFLIDFYASPPDALGQSYLGAESVVTDDTGDAAYVIDVPAAIGWTIAATATTVNVPWGETSEFSDVVTVAPPPAVQSVIVNDGSTQRSMVNRLEVTFNQTVTIDPGAFELVSKAGDSVALNVSTSVVAGRTVAVLTFWGKNVVGGSLADGNYTLTVRADKVHDLLGHQLDGDGNGLSGGNHVDEFFRLFGDADGDHDVDNLDFDQFKNTRYVHVGDPGFLWYLDFDGDGAISPKEQKQILNRREAFLRA